MDLRDMIKKAVRGSVGEMQFSSAMLRLDQRGELKHTAEDIPALVQEIHDDVTLRHRDKIVGLIYQAIRSDVLKESVRGVAKWYKLQLKAMDTNDIDIGTPAVA